ncbi:MAG: hypothetical protein LBI78_00355 [Campylobacteraceae bacterium]|nr:hypothetical protein [Campylobacteraceae bacterium]
MNAVAVNGKMICKMSLYQRSLKIIRDNDLKFICSDKYTIDKANLVGYYM